MNYKLQGHHYLIVLDRGEDLFDSLYEFVHRAGIESGCLSGIGALEEVNLGVLHRDQKKYDTKDFEGIYELLALEGNLTTVKGHKFFHLHATLGDDDFKVFGGHLFKAKVAVTAELYFTPSLNAIDRYFDESMGINLIDLRNS